MDDRQRLKVITRETSISLGLLLALLVIASATFAWVRSEVKEVRDEADGKVRELRTELQGRMDTMNAKLDNASEASMRALVIIERVDRRTQHIEAELRRSNGA